VFSSDDTLVPHGRFSPGVGNSDIGYAIVTVYLLDRLGQLW
jgi:hypothetical protein